MAYEYVYGTLPPHPLSLDQSKSIILYDVLCIILLALVGFISISESGLPLCQRPNDNLIS